MVKVTALFGHPVNVDEFEEYYENVHTPIVRKVPNLRRLDRARIVATPDGSPPSHHRIADLWFDSMEDLQSGLLGSPEGGAAAEDLQKFATGGVTLLICEVADS
jgi:uncharacterized protein (TIGR02118 family)